MAWGAWIAGQAQEGRGETFLAHNPCDDARVWEGNAADSRQVDEAVRAARSAFPDWAGQGLEAREDIARRFAAQVKASRKDLAESISEATGKPLWEALQEADLLPAKVEVSIAAQRERLAEKEMALDGHTGVLRFRPHGVVAVLGPFNLPAHLPHSHLVPALLAGNTAVFKPSEFAPQVGALLARLWSEAGLPPGVLQVVQGERATGAALASHPGLDGFYFTGSLRGGLALSRLFADKPGKILALELGGNNPLVVWDPESLETAAALIMQSAFITAGQRCVCARRLIIPEGVQGDALLAELLTWAKGMRLGFPRDNPEPFMGPVIHRRAARDLLQAQEDLLQAGAKALLAMRSSPRSPCLLSPGILDITQVRDLPDEEYFGPLLQVQRVSDFDEAVRAANATRFGLAAGLISKDASLWRRFIRDIRAGVVNWNRQITGANGKMPFGGIGASGNHRASAYSAADYCAYPMASLEAARPALGPLPPGLISP